MTRVLAALLLAVFAAGAFAQKVPYDVFPPADPPYSRVRYEASTAAGELPYAVNYTLWVPPGVKDLRGVIVHQHGCGEGSCKSGLTGAYDLHWQALARKHGCALLAPAYEQPEKADCQMWCDPRNGSDAAFRKALADLGKKAGHPELATVPWALWGHSGGGHWAGGMVMLHPDRVAAAWLRSGVPLLKADPARGGLKAHTLPAAALTVPIMCNLGTKEGVTVKDTNFAGVWPANQTFFGEVRGKGGLVGVAIDPLSSHDCGNQRYLAIPWLDACLTARLPKVAGEPLRTMPTDTAWLASPIGAEALAAAKQIGDPLKAAWLPNEAIAKRWAEYVADTKVSDLTPPPAPSNVKLRGTELTWEAEADLESGLAAFVIERDGKVLATVPEQGKNPFGRPVFQNLQYSDTPSQPLVPMRYTDAKPEAGKTHTYRVVAVNTAGLKSKPSTDAITAADRLKLWNGRSPVGDGTFETADAYITVHQPEKPNGAAAVICPGGGYGGLVTGAEGHGIAKWLNAHGITGVVLEYRLPKGRSAVPLLDAQRAIRTVRAKAKAWGIDPAKVGIIGFSAGGHLASTAGTHFDSGDPKAEDAIDRLGCRPDFMILVYPVISMGEKGHGGSRTNLLGKTPDAAAVKLFSNETQVTPRTPPAFLAHAKDDKVVVLENSKLFYDALVAQKVPAELLELPSGGHGLNGYKGPIWDVWQTRSLAWLAEQKFVPTAEK